MIEFFELFKDTIMLNLPQIWRLFVIPFMSLGLVYIFGRLLNILKTDQSKNILALFAIIGITYVTGISVTGEMDIFFIVWDVCLYTLLSVIIYINICWKLYNRIETLLNKKVGKDNFKPTEKKKKKKKKHI